VHLVHCFLLGLWLYGNCLASGSLFHMCNALRLKADRQVPEQESCLTATAPDIAVPIHERRF
jgi:hypothetical protein